MAWPKFMQRLFANSGAGPLLREDIMPDLTGSYLPLSGGTVTGNLTVNGTLTGTLTGNADTATTLKTARTIRTNLASTSTASFNGSANITPGVTGILPIANGGTGASTAAGALTALGIDDAIEEIKSSVSGAVLLKWGGVRGSSISSSYVSYPTEASVTVPFAANHMVLSMSASHTYGQTQYIYLKNNGVTIQTWAIQKYSATWYEPTNTYTETGGSLSLSWYPYWDQGFSAGDVLTLSCSAYPVVSSAYALFVG